MRRRRQDLATLSGLGIPIGAAALALHQSHAEQGGGGGSDWHLDDAIRLGLCPQWRQKHRRQIELMTRQQRRRRPPKSAPTAMASVCSIPAAARLPRLPPHRAPRSPRNNKPRTDSPPPPPAGARDRWTKLSAASAVAKPSPEKGSGGDGDASPDDDDAPPSSMTEALAKAKQLLRGKLLWGTVRAAVKRPRKFSFLRPRHWHTKLLAARFWEELHDREELSAIAVSEQEGFDPNSSFSVGPGAPKKLLVEWAVDFDCREVVLALLQRRAAPRVATPVLLLETEGLQRALVAAQSRPAGQQLVPLITAAMVRRGLPPL